MNAGRYRKKPVVIDAVEWDGTEAGLRPVFDLIGDFAKLPSNGYVKPGVGFSPVDGRLDIPTLEGTMTASPGDWIVRGVKGECYPVKPDIFAATYEPEATGSAPAEQTFPIPQVCPHCAQNIDIAKVNGMVYVAHPGYDETGRPAATVLADEQGGGIGNDPGSAGTSPPGVEGAQLPSSPADLHTLRSSADGPVADKPWCTCGDFDPDHGPECPAHIPSAPDVGEDTTAYRLTVKGRAVQAIKHQLRKDGLTTRDGTWVAAAVSDVAETAAEALRPYLSAPSAEQEWKMLAQKAKLIVKWAAKQGSSGTVGSVARGWLEELADLSSPSQPVDGESKA